MSLSYRHFELWVFKYLCFLAGCWTCFYLQSELQNPVLAAATIGFLGTFIPNNRRINQVHIQATIYTGTFVAMGSKIDQTSPLQLLLVSALGTTLYFILDRYFKGLGGKLGSIAFITTLLSLLLRGLA